MRVLVISDIVDRERIILQLRDLCEGTSLILFNDIEKAKDFINDQVVKQQLPLDLIISYSSIGKRPSNDFRDFIRADYKRTYSKKDFNINTIPLVLIVEKDLNINYFKNYDLLIDDLGIEKLHIYSERFSLTIKNWRKKVLEELDSLGVKFNSGFIDYDLLITSKSKIFKPTQILSENFKLFPRKLNYYWLDYNKKQIEQSIDDFIKMLKRSEVIGKKGEEKLYHNFLNNNPSFLLRDTFSNYWYEPKFYKNSTEFEEPDYILKPNLSYKTDLSLLEVKLPNERFLTKSKFHPPLMSKLMKHIYQVNDYKDYLESDEFLTEINKTLGYIPKNINYNLLIGRLEDKEENSYMLEKRMRQINQMNLNLMTYDEIMDYQVKFFDRMKLLDIRS